MKTASPELIALLNSSQQFAMADLLTITLKSGTVLRYTSADLPLTVGGNTFTPFLFKRGKTRLVVGIEVDTLDLTLMAGEANLISGVPWPRFVQNGGLDGASVKLERAFLPEWGQPVTGTLWMFSGRVSETTPSRSEIRVSVKSDVEILNTPLPRNLYQPKCGFTLFDSGCALNKAAYKSSGSVQAGSTPTDIKINLGNGSGWFNSGTITFTSGANAGVTRTVKYHKDSYLVVPARIILSLPLPVAPAAGDTFDAYPGCEKSLNTCEAKFNNKPHFRGFPYVPVPETAY